VRAREGLRFGQGAGFFFSAFDAELVQRLVRGILSDSALFDGMHVIEVQLQETPRFGSRQMFRVGSPVLVKKQEESGGVKHLLWTDADSGDALTATMRHKLREAGLPDEGVRVYFSPEGATPKTKLVKYREVCNKASFCPVVVEGTAEQIAFAWEVGVGNSTGVGFGALV
jgi:CRISPR-associated endoribonuclease Cas6